MEPFLPWATGNEPCTQYDPAVFFPNAHDAHYKMPVYRKICGDCDVRAACYNHALKHEEHGIWAGTNANQRDKLRKQLGIKLESPSYFELVPNDL